MQTKHNPTEVGKRIREVRMKLGYSMDEFAARIDGKAKSGTVSNWETGKNLPNNERLKRIAELANISVAELIGNSSNNLKNKVIQYVEEIMNVEIQEMQSQKYKELYDIPFKRAAIEMLLEQCNFDNLTDIGIRREIKLRLDEYLDKVVATKRYMPHSNSNAISLISDTLIKVMKEQLDDYFKIGKDRIDRSYLKIEEINPDLSNVLYNEMHDILSKALNDINQLNTKYSND